MNVDDRPQTKRSRWNILDATMKTCVITLDDLELGQIFDGLEAHAELWERTRHYLETGEVDINDTSVIAECSKTEEAEAIAEHYRSMIKKIQSQMSEQDLTT